MAVQTIGDAGSRRFDSAAERLDYWIRRHAIPLYCGIHPAQNNRNSTRDRLLGLAAIGQSLKEQYDACAAPLPPHLLALVEQLKTQK
jgi:hypothetical protein